MLKTYKSSDKDRLYEWPGNELITKLQKEKKQGRRKEFIKLLADRIKEVQCEI